MENEDDQNDPPHEDTYIRDLAWKIGNEVLRRCRGAEYVNVTFKFPALEVDVTIKPEVWFQP